MSNKNQETQRTLESNQALLRQFVEHAPAPIAMFDRDMKYIMASRRFLTDYHLTLQDVVGRSHYEIFSEIPERWKAIHRRCLAGATERAEDDPFPRADGTLDWIRWEIQPWYEASGAIGGIILFSEVITKRKHAEASLKESEEQYRTLFEISQDAIFINQSNQLIYANPAAEKLFGAERPEQIIGKSPFELFHPQYHELIRNRIKHILDKGTPVPLVEEKVVRLDGAVIDVEVTATPFIYKDGQAIQVVLRDITARKRAEKALAASEQLQSLILESVEDGIHGMDLDGRIMFENPAALKMFGWRSEEMIGQYAHTLIHHHHADGRPYPVEECPLYRTLRDGQIRHVHNEVYFRQDGTSFPVEYTVSALRDDAGAIIGVIVSFRDVTERVRAEAARRDSEERFRQLAETIREVFWMTDPGKSRMLYISPAYEEIWGRSLERLYAAPNDWVEAIHPDDRSRVLAASRTQERSGAYNEIFRIVRPDGTLRWIRDRAYPIRDASGAVYRIAGIAEDITELKQLETQFVQSQKLEAIGELAGGIAHDFNNNLSAILGFSNLALDRLRPEDPVHRYITQVKKAGEQSAALTRQLLAFSRKQLLQLKVLDLNALIADMKTMLQRMIGESIELHLRLHPELGHVKADPGQLEQVLVNVVVNARDAMSHGGTLTLETGNVDMDEAHARVRPPMLAGAYVRLAVIDTGCGMDATTQARIFEPFFTTKEVGKGTGLGLSTVYGIIKQSGGYIWVDSTPGQGTTFTIYLPRVEAPLEAELPREIGRSVLPGAATVLLVEDEEMVRAVARETLQAQGYTVLEATNGGGALLISERHQGAIELLLTDVVMPYMSGAELAQRLTAQRPETKVLYMSGYTDDALAPHGVLQPGIAFLAKPFTPDGLLRAVQEALDAAA